MKAKTRKPSYRKGKRATALVGHNSLAFFTVCEVAHKIPIKYELRL